MEHFRPWFLLDARREETAKERRSMSIGAKSDKALVLDVPLVSADIYTQKISFAAFGDCE